jgi:hypothetical protein
MDTVDSSIDMGYAWRKQEDSFESFRNEIDNYWGDQELDGESI